MKIRKKPLLLFLLLPLLYGFHSNENGSLTISIENINAPKGVIWVGIYNSPDNFLVKERSILKKINVYRTGKTRIAVPALPYGEYAIALFHDINENGKMDNNFWGVPTEPYAFSGQVQSKWRLPLYNEVKFQFWQGNGDLKLKLEDWWD